MSYSLTHTQQTGGPRRRLEKWTNYNITVGRTNCWVNGELSCRRRGKLFIVSCYWIATYFRYFMHTHNKSISNQFFRLCLEIIVCVCLSKVYHQRWSPENVTIVLWRLCGHTSAVLLQRLDFIGRETWSWHAIEDQRTFSITRLQIIATIQ